MTTSSTCWEASHRWRGAEPAVEAVKRDSLVYECTACGHAAGTWLGRCPSCGGFGTLEAVPRELRRAEAPGSKVVRLADAEQTETPRIPTGLPGIDRVLGGGLVPGSVVLLAGDPGIGKSTLLLQIAMLTAREDRPVLYVSAEESERQVAIRARRLGVPGPGTLLLAESVVEHAVRSARDLLPHMVIVDSVQAMASERVPAVPGSVSQVREVAAQLTELAKRNGPPVFLVGHVTKEGLVAGPKSLEHLVDVVVEFAGGTTHPHRTVRATKNRFGSAMELALLAMTGTGLEEVANPSAALLADRRAAPGSAVAAVVEGTTPLLVEVQALVARSALVNPRRVAQGMEGGRLALLLAVLEKRLDVRLGDRDVFLNVAGGLAVDEPALDLAAAAAVVSSFHEVPLAEDLMLFGEVGLLGEIRAVPRPDERLREGAALGFRRCAVPASSPGVAVPGMTAVPMATITDVVDLLTA